MVGLRTQKRRRRECKTDYKNRLNLLKSGKKRIVIRKTNKYFIVSLVETIESQDKVLKLISSKELIKNGWDAKLSGSLKSIPAGYLTGILLSKELDNKEDYIVDIGMNRTNHGGRVFSVVKGLIVGGLKINADEKAFPSEEKINAENLSDEIKKSVEKVKQKLGVK